MRKALLLVLVLLIAGVPAATAKRTPQTDFASLAMNILPTGQSGSLSLPPTATDQAKLYDDLTARFDQVAGDWSKYFKPERFRRRGP